MSTDREPLETYFRLLGSADAPGASGFVLELFDEGTPVYRITSEVLAPAQVRVGELWQQGDWSVADEHAATAVTEAAVMALGQASRPRVGSQPRHIVLACPEGEWHTLPGRMAAVVATTASTRVTTLGPSLPADQLARRLSAGDVDLLALSCTMPTDLIGAARCISVAHEHDIPVMVGGRAFGNSPLRAHALGADGWSNDPAALLGPMPARTGVAVEPPMEVLLLDAVDAAVVALAYDRMVAAFPRLATMTPEQQARTHEDFGWMARYAAAAVLTGDPLIVEELLLWLCSLLAGRVPPEIVTTSALLLADAVEPDAPLGADLLRHAAGQVASPGQANA
ncbi:MAG: cobalamin B12-binding domain-containing protein [Dermatophilaceae bacterium]